MQVKPMKGRRTYFTLMEVMVAALILSLAVVASMSILGTAQSTVSRAERRRNRQHLMTLVTECYLMGGTNALFPKGMLPSGYRSECELFHVDDLHEEAVDPINGWALGEYRIRLWDAKGELVGENFVRKMVTSKDLGLD